MKQSLFYLILLLSLAALFCAAQPAASTSPQSATQSASPGSYVQYVPGTPFQQERGLSPAVITSGGKTVWLPGISALVDANGKSLAGDFDAQAKEVFAQIDRTLKRAGGSLQDVVTWTVYINDSRYGQQFGKIRHDAFPGGKFPGSARITVSNFETPGILIEIQAVAVIADRRAALRGNAAAAPEAPPQSFSVQYLEGTQEQKTHANSAAVITQGGKTIWLAGITGAGPHTGNFDAETRSAFDGIQKTLSQSGASLKDLVALKVFIKAEPADSATFAKVVRDIFPEGKYPASTVISVAYSAELIEIQGVAAVAGN